MPWLTRFLLIGLLILLVVRALGRLFSGMVHGLTPPRASGPDRGVRMVRDPVCGTFVVPSRALPLDDGREQQFFCSEKCRAAYRAGTSSPYASVR